MDTTAEHTSKDEARRDDVRIVGIGASAGGLEAFEQFLAAVPEQSGLAYVLVQHLDPTHENMLAELLGRITPMPVVQIVDRMLVEADHVYVIPPGTDLSVLDGRLHLMEPNAPRGLRLPIDVFFRSLALDQGEFAVGVILSGTGSDGTLGLRAIKERAGAAFVQEPSSATFDGMPLSVIDAGLADVVAPPAELCEEVIGYVRHRRTMKHVERRPSDAERGWLEKIVILLRDSSGRDFSNYKTSTLLRRIERRMGLHQLASTSDYVRYLSENTSERQLLFKELLIGVTSFFRDPGVWDRLCDDVIPALLDARPEGGVLRAWVPACSTGEEAYSLAIVLREAIDASPARADWSIQIFATDVDPDAITQARTGQYPHNIAADVSEERLARHFIETETGYRVRTGIRECVVFAEQDLITDPPFTKVDLLSCRNLLIYFDSELQRKVMQLFHYALNPAGVLVLGSAETVGAASQMFETWSDSLHIYRRRDAAGVGTGNLPGGWRSILRADVEPAQVHEGAIQPSLQSLVTELVVTSYAPAAVLVNVDGDILYLTSRTGEYLEPAVGKANMNIFNMARGPLGESLQDCFHRAVHEQTRADARSVHVVADTDSALVDIAVEPLSEPTRLRGLLLVTFTDVPASSDADADREARPNGELPADVRDEVRHVREHLQRTRQRMEATQEALRASNEELQSTNEELQSTNEELSTSKEEMQSMNEELRTVNGELQAKVNDLSQATADMRNLLDSIDIAIVFLDSQLRVRRFTSRAKSVFRLQVGDEGRPITDLATDLDFPALADRIGQVASSAQAQELEVAASGDRWFQARIIPYRTQDERIDGTVLTFTDITSAKQLEQELREDQAALEGRVATQSAALARGPGGDP